MMIFNNEILSELSVEGQHYLGSHLQTYLNTLKKNERANTSVGLRVAIDTHQLLSNSLAELAKEDLIEKRLNCSLYFCVTLNNQIVSELEILPHHLSVEAFQNLERTLQHYNMYWKGSSMYVSKQVG